MHTFITRIRTDPANIYKHPRKDEHHLIWFSCPFFCTIPAAADLRVDMAKYDAGRRCWSRPQVEGDCSWFQWGQDFGANLLVPKSSRGKNGTQLGRVFTPLHMVKGDGFEVFIRSNTFRFFQNVPSLERIISFEVTCIMKWHIVLPVGRRHYKGQRLRWTSQRLYVLGKKGWGAGIVGLNILLWLSSKGYLPL